MARSSVWPDAINTVAAAALRFFGLVSATYILHGRLQDPDKQWRRPHRPGTRSVPPLALHGFMLLVLAAIGDFLVLFTGAIRGMFLYSGNRAWKRNQPVDPTG